MAAPSTTRHDSAASALTLDEPDKVRSKECEQLSNSFDRLPNELVLYLLDFVPLTNLRTLACVSKRFRDLAEISACFSLNSGRGWLFAAHPPWSRELSDKNIVKAGQLVSRISRLSLSEREFWQANVSRNCINPRVRATFDRLFEEGAHKHQGYSASVRAGIEREYRKKQQAAVARVEEDFRLSTSTNDDFGGWYSY